MIQGHKMADVHCRSSAFANLSQLCTIVPWDNIPVRIFLCMHTTRVWYKDHVQKQYSIIYS